MSPERGRGLPRVLVIGGGELGSAVAHRLVRAGITVMVADIEMPTCVRREVCFAAALREGRTEIEGVEGVGVASVEESLDIAESARGEGAGVGPRQVVAGGRPGACGPACGAMVPVLAVRQGKDDYRELAGRLAVDTVVDARMLKRGQGMMKGIAPLVVGLGPGFRAPLDVDVVIETNRGHNLGRVIYDGEAEPDTGEPAKVAGYGRERVLRAPADGVFSAGLAIGQSVAQGQTVGRVGGDAEVRASIAGLLRGLVADGTPVKRGQKIGDIDPRGGAIDAATISDKGRAVAGGVLEAIIAWWAGRDARV